MKNLLLLISLFISSPCMAATDFYYGNVSYFSADGINFYGQSVSLVKRSVNQESRTIVEIVIQPSKEPSGKADQYITTLSRIDNSMRFSATDKENTFSGYLDFAGKEWEWKDWEYNIVMKSGEKILGEGSIDHEGIRTAKKFLNKNDVQTMLIKEDLKSISHQEYQEKYKELMLENL